MDILTLVNKLEHTPDCSILSPSETPLVKPEHILPYDVREFYQLCGGATFFEQSEYSMRIVSPKNFVLANPIILTGLTEDQFTATKHEISWSWYIVGKGETGEYLLIDLHSERLSRCYYSFWDRHAMRGYSPIIATSFTDLLLRLLANRGQQWYWERPDFNLGDAYD